MIKSIGLALLGALALASVGWYYTYTQLKFVSTQYETCTIIVNAQATVDKINETVDAMPDPDIRDWLFDNDWFSDADAPVQSMESNKASNH